MSTMPPRDFAAEQAVLGGILIDNTALDRVNLKPEDFYDRQHGLIFRAMQCLKAQGIPIDVVTLHAALKEETEQPLGSYLSGLADATPSAANVADYADIVRDKAGVRFLIVQTEDFLQRAYADESAASLCKRLRQRAATLPDPLKDPAQRGFKRIPWAELKHKPQEAVEWVVEGMFRRNGQSLLVSPPKAGKSSLARNLARCVALGHPFLGRPVLQGPVVYMALEEMEADVQEHFLKMGLPDAAPIAFVFQREPEEALKKLEEMIEDERPVLVVVDTLAHLLRVRDLNDYAEVTRRMQPLLALTRQSKAHLLFLHHSRKGGGSHGAEALGSTALTGLVDVIVSLKRGEHYRSISSTQRHGKPIEDLVLSMDPETGIIETAGTKAEVDIQTTGEEILAFLEEQEEPVTRQDIESHIEGRTKAIRGALKRLVEQGKIDRSGAGKKNDPYLYLSCSRDPQMGIPENADCEGKTEKDGNNNLSRDSGALVPEKNTCSLVPTSMPGTRKQESQKTISAHVAGLTETARDEVTKQVVSGWLH